MPLVTVARSYPVTVDLPPGRAVYRIAAGDTLSGIADRFGTTVDALMSVNPQVTDPNVIYAGRLLYLP